MNPTRRSTPFVISRNRSLILVTAVCFTFISVSRMSNNNNVGSVFAFRTPFLTSTRSSSSSSSSYRHYHYYSNLDRQSLWTSRTNPSSSSSSKSFPLYVQSKRRKNQNLDSDGTNDESSWIKLKKMFYNGLDGVSAIVQGADTEGGIENSVQKGRIQEGYDSSYEGTMRSSTTDSSSSSEQQQQQSPISRIGQQQYSVRVRQGPPISSLQQQRRQKEDSKKSSFENIKASVYTAVDFVTSPGPTMTPSDIREQKKTVFTSTLAVPSKPSMNRAAALSEELLSSATNPVERIQAEMEIREQEARARATVRNEKIRAKKEDLYRIVDSLQATVDALPETFDKTEAAVLEVLASAKTIPQKVERTAQDIQAIPDVVAKKAAETQRSIQETVERTQQVVRDVQSIPQTVARSVEETKQTLVSTQESVQEAVTTVKVLVGLEKPVPKPPKRPPPPPKSAKEIGLGIAGQAAKVTGKVAWWAGKNAATLAWKGAGVAVGKGIETIGPVVAEAWQNQITAWNETSNPDASPSSSSTTTTQNKSVKPEETPAIDVPRKARKEPAIVAKSVTQAQLDQELKEAQALAKEVADALELAEKALLMSVTDDSERPKM